jgi:putative transposase
MPERPPRLEQLSRCYDPPLYFITFNTHHRRKVLANAEIHERFVAFARIGETRGIAVGRYVLMPDHVHLFVQGNLNFVLTQRVRLLKRALSKPTPIAGPHWQWGFFNHVIRNSES